MAWANGQDILEHFARKLYLVAGVAEWHRIQIGNLRQREAKRRSDWARDYYKTLFTSAATMQKCRTIRTEGLDAIAREHGLELGVQPWDPIDGELLALSRELCDACRRQAPALGKRPAKSLNRRREFYFWIDSYINDMRAAACIIEAYLDAAIIFDDPIARRLRVAIKKTDALLVYATSCTSENTWREQHQRGDRNKLELVFQHIERYMPEPIPAAWFGLRPENLCAQCKAAQIPQRIKTM